MRRLGIRGQWSTFTFLLWRDSSQQQTSHFSPFGLPGKGYIHKRCTHLTCLAPGLNLGAGGGWVCPSTVCSCLCWDGTRCYNGDTVVSNSGARNEHSIALLEVTSRHATSIFFFFLFFGAEL
ncbi:hypothetical protein SODALDRAFT_195409 [Sodiomyces alkalinus F11]|uniref:Uncharacterized protein n=1 Tax=Sodiomyces alkalinus (strain CBS 110278 / VKM F-3762 / F11) TaxID=1314773 RepID=A0A3N2PSA9_SODAK|nr:hypothetical protein SODALDRAFT_195409 [Sodiomyces alkalinus F11]ROT37385.1 hypothetical protein SODALDRAFT_195409 [Sodiomyces alkalinus F11]